MSDEAVRPYAVVPLDCLRWQLRNRTYQKGEATDAAICAEISALVVMGDLPSWSCKELTQRYSCGHSRVLRLAEKVLSTYRRMNGEVAASYRRALIETFPKLTAESSEASSPSRETRARPLLKKEEKEVDSSLSTLAPPKADPRVEELKSILDAARAEHHPALTGKAYRRWSWKGKINSLTREQQVTRWLTEMRRDPDAPEGGWKPHHVRDVANWVYTSENPHAQGARSTGDPLDTLLRPAKRLKYLRLAEVGEIRQETREQREDREREERRDQFEKQHQVGRYAPVRILEGGKQ